MVYKIFIPKLYRTSLDILFMMKLRDVNLRKGSFGMAGILLWKSIEILSLFWMHLVLVTSEDRYKNILKL